MSSPQGNILADTSIPALPEMRPLRLGHRDVLHPLFTELRPQQSEFTFTNLFIWRDAYQLRLARVGEALAVFSWRADPEDSFVFPPIGASADADSVRRCLEHLAAEGHSARMARATEADLHRLGVTEDEFAIEADRDQWDYVYRVEDLVGLRGNRYHRKRNHIEQFTRQYAFTYRPLAPDLVPDCVELQDRWCDDKHCDLVATLRSENRAVKEALEQFASLGITAGCIEIDGKVEAFALGELLNPETVVIHLEKANAAYHGLYQLINQQFLEKAWSHVPFVNREQDMGLSGLRKAKQSYQPDHMVEKFIVRLR
jgi:hypothetical protein